MLINTIDKQTVGNRNTFCRLIKDVNILRSNGIIINVEGQEKKIFFSLELILGDNLGLHSLFGLNESFQSNYSCRFCLIHKSEVNKIFHESNCSLRTEKVYNDHIKNGDSSTFGIKEPCVFNDVEKFHFLRNSNVDVMHDLLEGVCQYDLGILLDHFIFLDKNIPLTLYELNILLQSFPYDVNEKNTPVEIYETHVKKHCITISAAEMHCLVTNLNLIIGHLVENDNPFWDLYLRLKRIITFATSKVVHVNDHSLLETEIEEYLIQRNELFPNNSRKSMKHHFLLHYGTVMRKVGPLANTSSIRFESKHRDGKIAARSAVSRVNICHSVALRHQLQLSYRLLTKISRDRFVLGPTIDISIDDFSPNVQSFVSSFGNNINMTAVRWIKRDSYIIRKNTVLMIASEHGPEFYVTKCIIHSNSNISLVCIKIQDFHFNNHYCAYQLTSTVGEWIVLALEKVNIDGMFITQVVNLSHGMFINKTWI